ncbi:MAG: 4Fe-4S dicluster domain-containing protein [Candidatus Kariarchaeaceae archaeon]|jgi:NAD-dependent dihydropyrimidine dehydrogenase PreA subunit
MATSSSASNQSEEGSDPVMKAIHHKFKIKPITPDRVKTWYQNYIRQPLNLDTTKKPVGQVHVIPERCKECTYCWEFCPEDVLAKSEELNSRGYHYPAIAEGKDQSCINCGFCKEICPDFAIFTTELEGKEVVL